MVDAGVGRVKSDRGELEGWTGSYGISGGVRLPDAVGLSSCVAGSCMMTMFGCGRSSFQPI